MRISVYIGNPAESTRVANDISRYFCVNHPEYFARIVNFDNYREFDAYPGKYSMDLYVLELDDCRTTDAGFSIAKKLRGEKINCALVFIVPTEAVAMQITREMLSPSYTFLSQAETREINSFLDHFVSCSAELAFIEFTFQYKKWLVNTENITYIQTCGDKTLIVCVNTTLETTERLADLERKLPGYFFRVDKGCLINTKRLTAVDFTEHKAMFGGVDYVYMSRRGSKKLFDRLKNRNSDGEDMPE